MQMLSKIQAELPPKIARCREGVNSWLPKPFGASSNPIETRRSDLMLSKIQYRKSYFGQEWVKPLIPPRHKRQERSTPPNQVLRPHVPPPRQFPGGQLPTHTAAEDSSRIPASWKGSALAATLCLQ